MDPKTFDDIRINEAFRFSLHGTAFIKLDKRYILSMETGIEYNMPEKATFAVLKVSQNPSFEKEFAELKQIGIFEA